MAGETRGKTETTTIPTGRSPNLPQNKVCGKTYRGNETQIRRVDSFVDRFVKNLKKRSSFYRQ
jgi:hypothetical protein